MMPLPFVKVTAKAFKRNLLDDGDHSDSTTDSSSSSSSSRSSSSSSRSRSRSSTASSDGSKTTTTTVASTTTTDRGDGDKSRPASSVALKDLQDLNYTVPLPPQEDDPEAHTPPSSQRISTSRSGSTTTTTLSSSATSGSTTLTSGSTTSGSTTSGTTSATGSSSDPSSKTGGGATTSSSDFTMDFNLDPDDVIDPRTGRHIFARTAREVKITAPPDKEMSPPPTLRLDPSGRRPPVTARVTHAVNLGMHSARSSVRSSKTARSASRGFKKARKMALLTLRVGEYVVKTQVLRPVVTKAKQEWKTFNRFREHQQAQRRSKTLDWFEDRVENAKREEGIKRQRQQDQRRAKWRKHLKLERSQRQLNDFLSETRKEFVDRADRSLAASLEKERVRDYFLNNNDSWQMQTLTRQVQEDKDRERKRKEDAEADKVRDGQTRRQAAADEYLAEYDRTEVMTQATLRIMRRSGIIAGVNAPLPSVEEAPLETDTHLLLRLKRAPSRVGVAQTTAETETSSNRENDTVFGGPKVPPPPAGGGSQQQQHQRMDRLKIPGANASASSRDNKPPSQTEEIDRRRNSGAVSREAAAAATAAPPAESHEGKASRGGGISRRAGGHSRGKKKSSGAFEVDLLRFRGVEEMRGWKLGVPGGESLARDFASGACPRLRVLRLGWCSLGDRGARAVVRALCGGGGASGPGRTLQELDLRGNAVTVIGLRVLGSALAFGGLPALQALDLGSNSLRDEGGKAVAHRLLAGAGTWRQLARLDLSGNGMRDGGVEAVFKAVTAPGATLAPDVEVISVRDNFVSSGARQRLRCPPAFLVM